MLSSAQLTVCRDVHFGVKNGHPRDWERPSDRQLSALSAWLLAAPGGRHRAPAVCFTIWGPYEEVAFEERAAASTDGFGMTTTKQLGQETYKGEYLRSSPSRSW